MDAINVSIYIETNCWAGIVMLVKEALAIAGTLHARSGDLEASRLFKVSLVGRDLTPVRSFTGGDLIPDATIRSRRPHVIVVPPLFFTDDAPHRLAPAVCKWLVKSYEEGAIVLGLASGVRTLAATGLLDGLEATGNPADQKMFARHYPGIRFSPQLQLSIDERIVTAATVTPCLDACAYIISRFHGEAVARKFTRYTNSVAQPTYEHIALSNAPLKQHADPRIRQAQEFIERHFMQKITVAEEARRAAMSVRNFSRRFQQAVGQSPHAYLTGCRLEHAKDLLARPELSMLEVALQCGFADAITLRRAFRDQFAQTPTQYRASLRAEH
jgi:AraC family transcriptional activator FtrA